MDFFFQFLLFASFEEAKKKREFQTVVLLFVLFFCFVFLFFVCFVILFCFVFLFFCLFVCLFVCLVFGASTIDYNNIIFLLIGLQCGWMPLENTCFRLKTSTA